MKNKLILLAGLAIIPLAGNSSAQTLFWDGGTADITTNGVGVSQGATGTWDNSTVNWDQGAGLPFTAWISGADAIFAATNIPAGGGVVTLNAPITANSITVATTNYIFTDGGNTANTLTIENVTNSQITSISNNLVNFDTFSKAGSSTLTLLAPSPSLNGNINVEGGTLVLGNTASAAQTGPTSFGNVTVAANATLRVAENSGVTYAQSISGAGGFYAGGPSYTNIITLVGQNTFTGPVTVNEADLEVTSINDTNPCALGNGTNVFIGASSSASYLTYIGYGDTTARAVTLGGTSVNTLLNSSGFGALIWDGPVLFATTNLHNLNLGGTAVYVNVFGGTIPDNTPTPTEVEKSGTGLWMLAGTNTYSGGTLIAGGTLIVSNDFALGAATGPVAFLGSYSLKSTNYPVILGATRTITVSNAFAGSFGVTDTNNFYVASFITGPGAVTKASTSYALGVVRFSNNTNSFSGIFTAGYGNTEFTSAAAPGTPSSLGQGASITIANSTSSGMLNYVGAANSSTTRPLSWMATTGGYSLSCTNTGTIAYLSAASLVNGAGAKTLTLTGSNTGTNTLAQVINDDAGSTSLAKTGDGSWVLTGANTYSGLTTVSGGTLYVSKDANLGTNTLTLNGGALSATASFALNVNRAINLGPTGTLDVAAGQTLSYAGVIGNSGANVGGLLKTSAGTLTLSGANTYTGDTTISNGVLALSGSGSIADSSSIAIDPGATFDVSGIGAGYTLGAAQTLLATNGGTASIKGRLNLGSASVIISYTNGTPALNVTDEALTLGTGNAVTMVIANGGNPLAAGNYTVVSAGVGGSVTGAAPTSVTVTGDGIASGSTAALAISGGQLVLQVSGGTLYPPVLSGLTVADGSAVLTFSGTNGQPYQVLSATNLLTPLTNWTILSGGTLTGSSMSYTNSSATNAQQFYLITSP